MASTKTDLPHNPDNTPKPPGFDWRGADLRYYAYNFHLRKTFGHRVQRVSVDAGFTCPNVDGTVALGGCTFCDNRSFSPSRRLPRGTILGQIDEGISRMKARYKCEHFMAYFQPATNTYAPVDQLRELYFEAIEHPQVVAMAIGTRPDCVPDDVLELLSEVARKIPLTVEYGMQTMHDQSLDWMNRGHHHDVTVEAMERSRGLGFELCTHIMLGLPGETHEMMLQSAKEVGRLGFDAVKLHNLYAVKDTPLAQQVKDGEVRLMEFDEYIKTAVDFLELIPPSMVVERISGEAPASFLVGPEWCLDKPAIIRAFDDLMTSRETWQGKKYAVPSS